MIDPLYLWVINFLELLYVLHLNFFEFTSGVMETLLADPFTGDGTKHPDEHLRYVDDVCGLFNLAGVPGDVVKKKVFPLS